MTRNRPWPEELDLISEKIGQSIDLVQGPGGNTSWKDKQYMWVKASGLQLKDALTNEIFCKVKLDEPFINLLNDGKHPSIETSLHSILPYTYVVHVHAVFSMALGFQRQMSTEAIQFLKSAGLGVLDYYRPGKSLSNAIFSFLENSSVNRGLILKNHGIVLWGNEITEIYRDLMEIETKLANLLPINGEILAKIRENSLEAYLIERFLTPDHAVFGPSMNAPVRNSTDDWLSHLRASLEKAISCISDFEMIKFLDDEEVESLQNWEAEKARRGMNT
jgi:rhamnose utilization protein RhaD (predicted bifunctional aldolase and dehydrogenase)